MNCRIPDASGTGRKEGVEGRAVRSGGGAVTAERTKFVYSGLQIDPQLQIHTLVHTTPRSCSPPPLFLVERGSVMLCLWPIRVVHAEMPPAVWFVRSQHGQHASPANSIQSLGLGMLLPSQGLELMETAGLRFGSAPNFSTCASQPLEKSSGGVVTLKRAS